MRTAFGYIAAAVAALAFGALSMAVADEAPISGTVKNVDASAETLLVESASKGKVRQVVIYIRPESKVVRFVRSTDASKPGFDEQPATLGRCQAWLDGEREDEARR
jgi:hypothetical protein